jgi:hypothetical protein
VKLAASLGRGGGGGGQSSSHYREEWPELVLLSSSTNTKIKIHVVRTIRTSNFEL